MIKETKKRSKHLFYRWIREIIPPISKNGTEATQYDSLGFGGGVRAIDFPLDKRPKNFSPSTIILNSGFGKWEFEIESYVLRDLIDMSLRIETIRTHGMLHTPVQGRTASIYVNEQLVDEIHLVKPHPHGSDFGVDTRRTIPVYDFINKNKSTQTVQLTVDNDVLWDIDRIILEPIIYKKEIKPEVAMIIGALISFIIGVIGCVLSFLS